ncbi:hypothetical protein DFS33DRAFT_906460 [Desarmillaria ectypa]|nr:hypothetical protein DFS33DRAFT_906460 [Desarmillaria ectypa]
MGLQCVICLCDFTNPVCIPCGHVFCSECLNKVITGKGDSAGDGFKATYPFCREKFPIAIPNLRYLPEKLHPFVVDPLRKVFITSDNTEKLELISHIENLEKETRELKQRNANLESDRDPLQGKCAEAERLNQVCLDENRRLSADCTTAKAQASIYGLRVKKQAKTLDEVRKSFGIAREALERDGESGWSHRAPEMPFFAERERSIGLPRDSLNLSTTEQMHPRWLVYYSNSRWWD